VSRPPRRRTVTRMVTTGVMSAVLICCTSLGAMAASPTPVDVVRHQLAASHAPEAAFAVLDHGRVSAGGFGQGIDADTPLVLGSISKSFTALAVMQLADRGEVSLDAPIRRYIPDFRTADPAAVITVRQLLEQTSGLPTSAGSDVIEHPELSLSELVHGAANVHLATGPGEVFHYCNLNYVILGFLVEQVSGQSFGDYVTAHIFKPLSMSHSYASIPAARAAGMPDGSTVWFGATIHQNTPNAAGALPAGYLSSTANDMAHYLQMQLGDGSYQGTRVVSAARLRDMHTAAAPTPPDTAAESTTSYGFGWGIGKLDGHVLLAHDGDTTGYHANMALLPETGQAIVVLTSRNGFLTDPSSAYRAGLTALVEPPAPTPDSSFVLTYVIVDTVALAVVLAMVASLARRRRWSARVQRLAARRGRVGAVAPTVVVDLLLAVLVYEGVFAGVGILQQGFPLSVRVMFGSVPDVTALVLLAVAFFLLKAIVDAWLGLLVTRTRATRALEPPLPAGRGSSAQVAVGSPLAKDSPVGG
jgi:CubicO group peptidase (beta-lactamase class C family)